MSDCFIRMTWCIILASKSEDLRSQLIGVNMKHIKPVRYKTKVLPLPYYIKMNLDVDPDILAEELSEEYLEVPVVFNRNGLYMNKGYAWFEVNGRAYRFTVSCAKDYFDSAINVTDEKILRTNELEALKKAFEVTSNTNIKNVLRKRLREQYVH